MLYTLDNVVVHCVLVYCFGMCGVDMRCVIVNKIVICALWAKRGKAQFQSCVLRSTFDIFELHIKHQKKDPMDISENL